MWVRMRRRTELYDVGDVRDGGHAGAPRRRLLGFPGASVLLAVALGVSMGGLLGCGENDVTPSTDADAGMSDGLPPMPDGQLEAPVPPPSCTTGLCSSPACAAAENQDVARGCRFYAAQLDNIDSDDGKNMMLVLANGSSSTAATYQVEMRSGDGWTLAAPQDVIPPLGSHSLELNRPVTGVGVTPGFAYRITSDSPILATQIISDDSDRLSTSSAGTVLLPARALGGSYMALTFTQLPSAAVTAAAGGRAGAGMIAVVGTVDGTSVNLRPSAPTMVMSGVSFIPNVTSDEFTAKLNEGDVLQVFSTSAGDDLTGSSIDADHPIEVFSGNVFTTYGYEASGFNGGDMAIEQLPPLPSWGTEYVGARLAPQDGCDPFFGPGGGSWQLLAAKDGTRVTLSPSPGTIFIIENTQYSDETSFGMNAGETRQFKTIPDPAWTAAAPPTGDFVASAPQPFLLAQWLDCEPGLSLGMDTRFGATDMTFGLPPGFQNQVVIARRAGMPVTFDGVDIPGYLFQPASAKGAFEVVRLTDGQFGPCADALDTCVHTIKGQSMAVGWRGSDIVCSYSLTVPPANPCLMPALGCEP